MTSNYNLGNEKLGTMINLMTPETRNVLYALNGYNDYEYGGYDESLGRRQRIYWRERALSRTESGRHYRMAPELAQLLMAETVEPVGAHPTDPPTVLVTSEETLSKLDTLVTAAGMDPVEVIATIRQELGIPHRSAEWDDLMHGYIR